MRPREYIQNMAKTCFVAKHTYVKEPCGREWRGPLGVCQAGPHRPGLVPPSQPEAGQDGGHAGSWGRHVCPLFTWIHGWAQTTELSSVCSLVGHGQFWNSRLPNASPSRARLVSIAVLDSPGPFFPLCFSACVSESTAKRYCLLLQCRCPSRFFSLSSSFLNGRVVRNSDVYSFTRSFRLCILKVSFGNIKSRGSNKES